MANDTELELQYNARKTVADHDEIAARWDREAEAYRLEADAELDIPYGTSPRNRFDFFRAATLPSPVLVYIHGGYWRSRGRETFSHVARPFNARGISVAIPSYDLCPNVTVVDIVRQLRDCLVAVWQKTGRRIAVAGHSAGGHLTASMLATDWQKVSDAPADLLRSAYGISGLYDLVPLLETSVNDDLKLSREEARAASPLFGRPPAAGAAYVAAVGGDESAAFRDQSLRLAEVWGAAGVATEYNEVPGTNHFTIVDAFLAPGSSMAAKVAEMAIQASEG